MSVALFYGLGGAALFGLALHAFIAGAHLLRKILAFNIMGSGVFLIFIALAYRAGRSSPDPVPHAMVLTGIVVSISATAFALALACRIHATTGRAELPEDKPPQ
jgi:multicomponent Na+:H+ antiporter subunit C